MKSLYRCECLYCGFYTKRRLACLPTRPEPPLDKAVERADESVDRTKSFDLLLQ